VVLNFQAEEQTIEIDMSGVDFDSMTDLQSGAGSARRSPTRVALPAYGYTFIALESRKDGA
jgi:hypothetical protein